MLTATDYKMKFEVDFLTKRLEQPDLTEALIKVNAIKNCYELNLLLKPQLNPNFSVISLSLSYLFSLKNQAFAIRVRMPLYEYSDLFFFNFSRRHVLSLQLRPLLLAARTTLAYRPKAEESSSIFGVSCEAQAYKGALAEADENLVDFLQ